MDQRIVGLAIDVNWRHLALGHEVTRREHATFVRNTSLPLIYDANFLFAITAAEPAAIRRMLADAQREYAHAAQITIRTDLFTPPAVDAWLLADGWSCALAVLLVLTERIGGTPGRCTIRPIEDQSHWDAYLHLKSLDLRDTLSGPDRALLAPVTEGMVAASRMKSPPVEHFLAYRDDQPVGYCSAWRGVDRVGQVEDLYVHHEHRKQGIATALLHHAVSRARSGKDGPVALVVHPANTARQMYLALGWEPVAVCRQYGRSFAS